MNNLNRVTITGADDFTDIDELARLSDQFPFVEWGILVSRSRVGSYRFPSTDWIERFSAVAHERNLHVSTHLCGQWVRRLLIGKLIWDELPDCLDISQRVQINTHADRLPATTALFNALGARVHKEFIFQWDGVNDHLAIAAKSYGLTVSALFDTSGGAGILPASWPPPRSEFTCGYAGGLGPENVITQIEAIERVCNQPFWIDMERRVRTNDDSRLDMKKVRCVLETAATVIL